jgi:hypothetical protein
MSSLSQWKLNAVIFKLDENLEVRLVRLLVEAGLEADTILDQKLSGDQTHSFMKNAVDPDML